MTQHQSTAGFPGASSPVLFVCTENICRSPSAEGIFRKLMGEAGAGEAVSCDSAGTRCHHVGSAPDPRAVAAAARRGYDIAAIRARAFGPEDFGRFELVLAMDRGNYGQLFRLAKPGEVHKLKMMMDFSVRSPGTDVPDPFYGGTLGFERVLDVLEDAVSGLVQTLRTR